MKLKRSWDRRLGRAPLIAPGDGACRWLEVDMLRLEAGQHVEYDEPGKEFGLLVLGGQASVAGPGFDFRAVGARRAVFDGPASAVYIPKDKPFCVVARSPVRAAVFKAPAAADFPPALIRPEDVRVQPSGKPGWTRTVHTVLGERVGANMLLFGEVFIEGGQWTSYPPHKHDTDDMPDEAAQDEAYYFEFDKPTGFGIQRVYTADGALDETYTVASGDLIAIPRGYHPCCCAPGYRGYVLWAMAGERRGFHMRPDPSHQWLR